MTRVVRFGVVVLVCGVGLVRPAKVGAQGKSSDHVDTYTGCLSSDGKLSSIAPGAAPLHPCGEDRQVTFNPSSTPKVSDERPASLNWIVTPGAKGDKGDKGVIGTSGSQGHQGEQGSRGEVGPRGPKGDVGPAGPMGPMGATGPMGPQGPDGPAGHDGAPGLIGSAVRVYDANNVQVGEVVGSVSNGNYWTPVVWIQNLGGVLAVKKNILEGQFYPYFESSDCTGPAVYQPLAPEYDVDAVALPLAVVESASGRFVLVPDVRAGAASVRTHSVWYNGTCRLDNPSSLETGRVRQVFPTLPPVLLPYQAPFSLEVATR